MSNADARGGVIAIGIHDGSVEGFEAVGERKLNDLMDAPSQFCPEARVQSKTVQHDDKSILLLFVDYRETRVVALSDGTVYTRVGDRDRQLNADQVALLRDDKGETSVETEVIQGVTIESANQDLLRTFVENVRTDLDLQFDTSPEDVLIQRRLGVVDNGRFRFRLAGILLLGQDPALQIPGCKVRFIRYEGTEERTGTDLNVIKDQSFEGPVPILIDQSTTLVLSQLREYRALRPDGTFDLRPEYPHDCVREAIVNACVHRSYGLRNQPVFIRMFDDRLEIESPGGFIAPVTPDTVYEYHSPRNPFLMSALQHLKLVRMANEGTRRMRHLMRASDLPDPEFTEARGPISKVTVVLRNDIEHRRVWIDTDLTAIVGAQLATALSDEEKRVLNYLAENGRMTVSDAYRITTVKTWHSARRIMDDLLEKGLVNEVKERTRDPKAHFVLASSWQNDHEDAK